MSADSTQNYTDISDIVARAHDAFNVKSWGHPESEPRPAPKEQTDHIEMHEIVEDEPLPDITPYLQSQTVNIKLPKSLKDMGVEVVNAPVQYPKHKTIQIPLTDEKIVEGKKMPLDSSFRWLTEICLRLLRMTGVRLKIAHGKAQRIMESEKPS